LSDAITSLAISIGSANGQDGFQRMPPWNQPGVVMKNATLADKGVNCNKQNGFGEKNE